MSVIYHPEARREAIDAANYLEEQRAGYGSLFRIELDNLIQEVLEFPLAGTRIRRNVRRRLLRRFPYGILYGVDGGEIQILAVMHLNRDPDYWIHRENAR